jgi:hypothetical protein
MGRSGHAERMDGRLLRLSKERKSTWENDGSGGDEMNNETRVTRNETGTAQDKPKQKIGRPSSQKRNKKKKRRELVAAHRTKCRVRQSASSPGRLRQGQRWSATLCASPVWAHDSDTPWPVVVPVSWHRFRGQTRQGGWHLFASRGQVPRRRSKVSLVRACLSQPGSQPWARAGMRPRQPLQDVREVIREVTEVGGLR